MGIEHKAKQNGLLKDLQQKSIVVGLYSSFLSIALSVFSHSAGEIIFAVALLCSLISASFVNKNYKFLNLAWLLYFLVLFSSQAINQTFEKKIFVRQIIEFTVWFTFSGLFQKVQKKILRHGLYILLSASSIFALLLLMQALGVFPTKCQMFPNSICTVERVGFLNPFVSGVLLLISFFINFNFFEKLIQIPKRNIFKCLFVLALALQFMGLFVIGQRSIIVGFIFGILFWAVLSIKKLGFKVFITTLGLTALSGVLAIKFSPTLKEKIFKMSQNKDVFGVDCRLNAWKVNWNRFLETPWIGNGKAVTYHCESQNLSQDLPHAHNIYIQKLVDSGLIGFFAMFAFLGNIFWTLFKSKNKKAFAACFAALAIVGCFDEWLLFHTALTKAFLLMIALAL